MAAGRCHYYPSCEGAFDFPLSPQALRLTYPSALIRPFTRAPDCVTTLATSSQPSSERSICSCHELRIAAKAETWVEASRLWTFSRSAP